MNYSRTLEWQIYGAKHRVCPTCLSPQNKPCLNMADIKAKRPHPRVNRTPHEDRIDWDWILQGLKTRGYYRKIIEDSVRRQLKQQQEARARGQAVINKLADQWTEDRPMPEWAQKEPE